MSPSSSRPPLLIINASDVRRLLPMPDCIEVLSHAMQAASRGEIQTPARSINPMIDASTYLALMPGSLPASRLYGAKIVSFHPQNPARGLQAIQGFIVLFDHATGSPVAIVEGAELTAIRTAAASGLATRTLARPTARTHGVFGAGVQASKHVEAIAAVRPIEQVLIWARERAKADLLAAELQAPMGCDIRATSDPAEAAACDIVSTVTSASEPVLRGDWLRPGAHVNLVGAHSPITREADDEVMRRSVIFVDSIQSAMNEAGDLLIPMHTGVIARNDIFGEIGQVLAGHSPGRIDDGQITLYKSLGVAAQDLSAAAYVHRMACEQNVGCTIWL